MQHTAYIALGSNIEPRAETLIKALSMLDARQDVNVVRVSQLIQTEPVGPPDQPKYFNGAAQLATSLEPRELLDVLMQIEASLGRDRSKETHWGPRTCDLDLLLYDGQVIQEDHLEVPHPRMHERIFVLQPLRQIAPEAVHPVLGKTIAQLLAEREAGGCR